MHVDEFTNERKVEYSLLKSGSVSLGVVEVDIGGVYLLANLFAQRETDIKINPFVFAVLLFLVLYSVVFLHLPAKVENRNYSRFIIEPHFL